jgi:ketosteroid isomerase-like protein
MVSATATGSAAARSQLKAISYLLALAGLLSAVVYGERPSHINTMPNIEKEVLQVIEDFNGAFARNDVEKYFSYIDPEVTVITPSNPYRVEGIHDDREEFEYSLHIGVGRVGYFQEMQPKVQLFGDTAVVTYFSRGSYGPNGQAKIGYYKETDVLTRRSSGWKIVHIHLSSTPQNR